MALTPKIGGPGVAGLIWPTDSRLITNAGGPTVRQWLSEHLSRAESATIVTGYAGLLELARLLAGCAEAFDGAAGCRVRVVMGNEPDVQQRRSSRLPQTSDLSQQVLDYWFERGLDVRAAAPAAILADLVTRGVVEFRINGLMRPLHAKMYVFPYTALIGSSNASAGGLGGNLECNVEVRGSERPQDLFDAHQIARNYWDRGSDYRDGILELLRTLFDFTTAEIALARAHNVLTESGWAQATLHARAFRDVPLLPHQEQGLDEALYILERNGAVLISDPVGAGKTALGAALLSTAIERLRKAGTIEGDAALILCPPRVVREWRRWTRGMNVRIHPWTALRTTKGARSLFEEAEDCDILLLDEAHNLVGKSTQAKNAARLWIRPRILLTATPMNEVGDLLALIEFQGLDNQTNELLGRIEVAVDGLKQLKGRPDSAEAENTRLMRKACMPLMLRRSRDQIMAIVAREPARYERGGKRFRWPEVTPVKYRNGVTEQWRERAAKVRSLLEGMSGRSISRRQMQDHFRTDEPRGSPLRSVGSGKFVHPVGQGLIWHLVINGLRSSRAAALAILLGDAGASRLLGYASIKDGRGSDMPLKDGIRRALQDARSPAQREQLHRDAEIVGELARTIKRMPAQWDAAKLEVVKEAVRKHHRVVVFDRHLPTLAWLAHKLGGSKWFQGIGGRVIVAAGRDVTKGSKAAMDALAPGSRDEGPLVVLAAKALREGVNLQRAGCVVLLGLPFTPTELEQTLGRIDRIDSPHEQVFVYYPQDCPDLPLKSDEKLYRRMRVTHQTVGVDHYLGGVFSGQGDFAMEAEEYLGKRASDAFSAVRALAEGEHRIIGNDALGAMRKSRARIVGAKIAVVPALSPWAFLCLAPGTGRSPEWVLFEPAATIPLADAADVAVRLRELLRGHDLKAKLPIDDAVQAQLEAFSEALETAREDLLTPGGRRALEQMRRVMPAWAARGDEAANRWQQLVEACGRKGEAPPSDLRRLTGAWASGVAQVAAEFRHGRTASRPFTIDLLTPSLEASPPPPRLLERVESAVSAPEEVQGAIVAFIVGVPPLATSTAAVERSAA